MAAREGSVKPRTNVSLAPEESKLPAPNGTLKYGLPGALQVETPFESASLAPALKFETTTLMGPEIAAEPRLHFNRRQCAFPFSPEFV
jgi:hypothetical protein